MVANLLRPGSVSELNVLGLVVAVALRLGDDRAVGGAGGGRPVERAKQGEVTDPLTGLANRRGLEQQGARSWSTRARERAPLAVLVIDVDHFKRVNDTHGHAAGDDILRRPADLIAANMRHEDDGTVRLGGEEIFVLGAVTPGEAVHSAERQREQGRGRARAGDHQHRSPRDAAWRRRPAARLVADREKTAWMLRSLSAS